MILEMTSKYGQMPVVRDRTALFLQFRRSYRATAIITPEHTVFEDEQYMGVAMNDPEEGIELRSFTIIPPAPMRDWLHRKSSAEKLLEDIRNAGSHRC